jgi:hypothetical protein
LNQDVDHVAVLIHGLWLAVDSDEDFGERVAFDYRLAADGKHLARESALNGARYVRNEHYAAECPAEADIFSA